MASRLSARSKQPYHAAFSTAGIRARGIRCVPLPAPRPACTCQGSLAFLRAPAPLLALDACDASLLPYIHFSRLLCLSLQTHKPPKASSQQKLPVHASLCIGQWRSPVLGDEALMFPFAALQKIIVFMQPSALEASGYTLPTTIPCTSKYPESSI